MKLEHSFTVPAPVDTVWTALLDPERVAPCFPGATITSASGDDFAGAVKVRLGPIALQYKGSGRFTEADEAAHRTVIEASGTASGGQSIAAATVTAVLAEEGVGTVVRVATELSITGKPAQFGRRLMEDVGKKIISQFAENLADTLGPEESPEQEGPVDPAASPRSEAPAAATASAAATGSAAATASAAPPASPTSTGSAAPAGSAASTAAAPTGSAAPAGSPAPAPIGRPARQVPAGPVQPADDEIDLLDVAGGAVAKRVVPAVGGLVLLFLIIYWLRRR